MQHFDFVGGRKISIDAVDKVLGCIRFCWARGDLDEEFTPGKYFESCSLESLRRIVSVVEESNEVKRMNAKLERIMKLEFQHDMNRFDARERNTVPHLSPLSDCVFGYKNIIISQMHCFLNDPV